jgi:hypothetical protein
MGLSCANRLHVAKPSALGLQPQFRFIGLASDQVIEFRVAKFPEDLHKAHWSTSLEGETGARDFVYNQSHCRCTRPDASAHAPTFAHMIRCAIASPIAGQSTPHPS